MRQIIILEFVGKTAGERKKPSFASGNVNQIDSLVRAQIKRFIVFIDIVLAFATIFLQPSGLPTMTIYDPSQPKLNVQCNPGYSRIDAGPFLDDKLNNF